MKSEHRHELQQNELAHRLTRVVEWSRLNAPLLVGIVVGAAAVLFGINYFRSSASESAMQRWDSFFTAAGRQDGKSLEALGSQQSDTLAGQMANLLLGDMALSNGIDLMSTDRGAAETQLNEAKNKYVKVGLDATSTDPLIAQRAILGLARYYETVGMLDEATKEYQNLADKYAKGPYAEAAKRKVTILSESSTKAFAAWYREHKPLPPKPSDSLGLPPLGDLKLPSDESSFPVGSPGPTSPGSAAPGAGS